MAKKRTNPRPRAVLAGLQVAHWATSAEVADVFGVDERTLLNWRGRGLPYDRKPDGTIRYAFPHVLIWRTYWCEASEGFRVEMPDVPFECAAAWRAYLNARANYLGIDEHGEPYPPDILRDIPADPPRWRPSDWAEVRPEKAGRMTYVPTPKERFRSRRPRRFGSA